MKELVITVFCFSTGVFAQRPEPISEEVLNSPQAKVSYSVMAKWSLEGVVTVGRPVSEVGAYIFFESPKVALSAMTGKLAAELTKEGLLSAAESYVSESPEAVCRDMAASMMDVGIEAYRRNFSRYKKWKEIGLSVEERQAFAEDELLVNYLRVGKDLWSDMLNYKHGQGKYARDEEKVKEFLREIAKIKVEELTLAEVAERLKDVTDAAKADALENFPPYQDNIGRIRALQEKTGVELAFAEAEEEKEVVNDEGKKELEIPDDKSAVALLKKLEKRPGRPVTESVYIAINNGNLEEVWSHIYYKTCSVDDAPGREPLLHAVLEAEYEERVRKHQASGEGPIHGSDFYNKFASEEYFCMVVLLVDHGADINKAIRRDETPLFLATAYYTGPAIHLLASKGALVTEKVLINAAMVKNDTNLVHYLLKNGKGVDDDLLDAALEHARLNKMTKMTAFLEGYISNLRRPQKEAKGGQESEAEFAKAVVAALKSRDVEFFMSRLLSKEDLLIFLEQSPTKREIQNEGREKVISDFEEEVERYKKEPKELRKDIEEEFTSDLRLLNERGLSLESGKIVSCEYSVEEGTLTLIVSFSKNSDDSCEEASLEILCFIGSSGKWKIVDFGRFSFPKPKKPTVSYDVRDILQTSMKGINAYHGYNISSLLEKIPQEEINRLDKEFLRRVFLGSGDNQVLKAVIKTRKFSNEELIDMAEKGANYPFSFIMLQGQGIVSWDRARYELESFTKMNAEKRNEKK